jgi:hypothetical protein
MRSVFLRRRPPVPQPLAGWPRDPDAALKVTRGEKLIASRWIGARPFEMPMGGLAG